MTDISGRVRIDRRRTPDSASDAEAREVWEALLARPPSTNPRYLYDDLGSQLFERITELEEYYQTRTELALLEDVAGEIVDRARPRELVELGSGAGRKVHLLLDAIRERGLLTSATLLDINGSFLASSAERLAEDYPEMLVNGVLGDFTRDLDALAVGERRLLVLFAGTIGNFERGALPAFLAMVRRAMAPDDRFLVGLDLVKAPQRLVAAYDDSAGVTAAFNRNVLAVLNQRFGTDFEPDSFEHVAAWVAEGEWIEMRLRAIRDMQVRMPGDDRILVLTAGDEIRTEVSCKFTRISFSDALGGGRLALDSWWTDDDELFALALVKPMADRTREET